MTMKSRCDDSMALAKMSLEQLLYYVLVELRLGTPDTAAA